VHRYDDERTLDKNVNAIDECITLEISQFSPDFFFLQFFAENDHLEK